MSSPEVPQQKSNMSQWSRIKCWVRNGWDKFAIGLVVALLSWIAANALGLIGRTIDAASQAGVAALLAKDAKIVEQVTAELSQVTPIGCVVAWPASVPPPSGWHVCNGDVLDARDYPEIARVIDTSYGKEGPDKVK